MGEDAEDATVRDHGTRSHSRASSSERPQSGNSEDWSVISETDDRRSSFGSGHGEGNNRDRSLNHKRNGLTAAVLSVLPDALTVNTSLRLKPTASRP
jgi:sterol 3beta-glucosyltransferase